MPLADVISFKYLLFHFSICFEVFTGRHNGHFKEYVNFYFHGAIWVNISYQNVSLFAFSSRLLHHLFTLVFKTDSFFMPKVVLKVLFKEKRNLSLRFFCWGKLIMSNNGINFFKA